MAVSGTIAAVGIGGGMATQGYYANKANKASNRASAIAAEQTLNAKKEAMGYLDPYRQFGESALDPLSIAIMGKSFDPRTGEFSDVTDFEQMKSFEGNLGYQFRLDQALKGLERSQSARGGLMSGRASAEFMRTAAGEAANDYQSYINNLMGVYGQGQNAAIASGNTAIGAGSNLADIALGQGASQAQHYQNMGNVIGGTMTDIGGAALGQGLKNSRSPSSNPPRA